MYYYLKEFENIEFDLILYIYGCIKLYIRVFRVFNIFLYSYFKFNCKNGIKYLNGYECENRLELIKTITEKMVFVNIVYLKIFQLLCLNNDILLDVEEDYLLKYITNNIPYLPDDIDYDTMNALVTDYNIKLDMILPLNGSIISISFLGMYKNKNVVIEIIKNNINSKLQEANLEIETIINIISIIPFIRKLNLKECIINNKELLLEETNFVKEISKLQTLKKENANNIEKNIPNCYPEITNQYNNVMVIENIFCLTNNDMYIYK
tara:strand:- start:20099 stop:20893 length:795 start_codon:yes stop_codon:yes gene_type:complete